MPPTVSIIVPCFNEEKTIDLLLESIYRQTWPKSDLEVIIAEGLSSDHTRQKIASFQAAHPDLLLRLVDNPRRIIPAALNCALAAAGGDVIVRLDAHSEPAVDYVERCLADIHAGRGELVGGIWKIRPGGPGWLASSIASLMATLSGVSPETANSHNAIRRILRSIAAIWSSGHSGAYLAIR